MSLLSVAVIVQLPSAIDVTVTIKLGPGPLLGEYTATPAQLPPSSRLSVPV